MGATSWHYLVAYDQDAGRALKSLRERVFREGAFRPPPVVVASEAAPFVAEEYLRSVIEALKGSSDPAAVRCCRVVECMIAGADAQLTDPDDVAVRNCFRGEIRRLQKPNGRRRVLKDPIHRSSRFVENRVRTRFSISNALQGGKPLAWPCRCPTGHCSRFSERFIRTVISCKSCGAKSQKLFALGKPCSLRYTSKECRKSLRSSDALATDSQTQLRGGAACHGVARSHGASGWFVKPHRRRVLTDPPAGIVITWPAATRSGKAPTGEVLGCSVIKCPCPQSG